MEELLKSTAAQVPGMVVLAIIVVTFIRYMGRRDDMIREINRENITARELSRQVIEKNTQTAADNTEAMHNMTGVIREFIASTK